MVTTEILLPRGELANDPHGTAHPIFIADVATRAKPEIDCLSNDRGVRELAPRGLPSNGGGLVAGQLELLTLHAIMMAQARGRGQRPPAKATEAKAQR